MSTRHLMDVLGHSNPTEAETYSRQANKRTLTTDALLTLQNKKKAMPNLKLIK